MVVVNANLLVQRKSGAGASREILHCIATRPSQAKRIATAQIPRDLARPGEPDGNITGTTQLRIRCIPADDCDGGAACSGVDRCDADGRGHALDRVFHAHLLALKGDSFSAANQTGKERLRHVKCLCGVST